MASKKKAAKKIKIAAGKRISFKDVQISYLSDGVGGVEKLLSEHASAKHLLKRALADFEEQGKNADALKAYVLQTFGSAAGRGRAMPAKGETRQYRAQQLNTGGPFLRLPLSTLDIEKTAFVNVNFEADRIVVTKA